MTKTSGRAGTSVAAGRVEPLGVLLAGASHAVMALIKPVFDSGPLKPRHVRLPSALSRATATSKNTGNTTSPTSTSASTRRQAEHTRRLNGNLTPEELHPDNNTAGSGWPPSSWSPRPRMRATTCSISPTSHYERIKPACRSRGDPTRSPVSAGDLRVADGPRWRGGSSRVSVTCSARWALQACQNRRGEPQSVTESDRHDYFPPPVGAPREAEAGAQNAAHVNHHLA